jgi:malate synthase
MAVMAILAVRPQENQIEVTGPVTPAWSQILTPEAVAFVAELSRTFETRRRELLERRRARQVELDNGSFPDFLPETASVRQAEWTVAPIPADLQDRRVEITGPVERKMIINALNSGASVFMADFEDSNSPTWANNLDGHINLRDAVRREITYTSPEGKQYQLCERPATLLVRPRGWHLDEKHLQVDGRHVSGSLFDFGLYFFHNVRELMNRGSGPYFYLPKMESHLEARLWNDVFNYAQDRLGVPRGTIRATVLIETILGAFEMDEILYELRDHSAGLNCGRWDYIFSFIKKFRCHKDFCLPNRSEVTMDRHFLDSYVQLLIKTCHRRGIHAMGGMAAQIPIKNDPEANDQALDKVRKDKLREVKAGHDGTWVAHPGLVPIAKEIFDQYMPEPNQIARKRDEVSVTARDLLAVPEGTITEKGLRWNIDVGIQYLESWLRGSGCVPIYNLMEDAATAEICRAQVWQWVEFNAKLDDGRPITDVLVQELIAEQVMEIRQRIGVERFNQGRYRLASDILEKLMIGSEFPDFLTLVAYDYLD